MACYTAFWLAERRGTLRNPIGKHSQVHKSTVFRWKRKNSVESKLRVHAHAHLDGTAVDEADEMYSREERSDFVSWINIFSSLVRSVDGGLLKCFLRQWKDVTLMLNSILAYRIRVKMRSVWRVRQPEGFSEGIWRFENTRAGKCYSRRFTFNFVGNSTINY